MNRRWLLVLWLLLGALLVGAVMLAMTRDISSRDSADLLEALDAAFRAAEREQAAAGLASIARSEAQAAHVRSNSPASLATRTAAVEQERVAHERAAEFWEQALATAEHAITNVPDPRGERAWELHRLRHRARAGTGDLAGAASDLEKMLATAPPVVSIPERDRAREDLVSAYYHGARLLRLRGAADSEWRRVSERARQHARVLAESGSADTSRHQQNLEIIIDFERRPLGDLEAEPLPSECPGGSCRNLNLDTWPWQRQAKSRLPSDDRTQLGSNAASQAGGGS